MKRKTIIMLLIVSLLVIGGCSKKIETDGTLETETDTFATEETQEIVETLEADAAEESLEPKETKETKEVSPTTSKAGNFGNDGTTDAAAATTPTTKTPETTTTQKGTMSTGTAAGESSRSTANTETNNNTTPSSQVQTPQAQHTSCSWNGGNITKTANCNTEGVITYTCNECGKTKTETLAKTSHNYVSETVAATCTAAGKNKTYCSICGNVQSETSSGSATGHNNRQEVWYEAACTANGYYNNICNTCGHVEGVSVPPTAHAIYEVEVTPAACNHDALIEQRCRNCEYKTESWVSKNVDHSWITDIEGTYCAVCGMG